MKVAGAEKNEVASFPRGASVRNIENASRLAVLLSQGAKKGERKWSLMQLAYNFTRILNILGLDRFLECCKQLQEALLALFFTAVTANRSSFMK